jgi:hypothetical protein
LIVKGPLRTYHCRMPSRSSTFRILPVDPVSVFFTLLFLGMAGLFCYFAFAQSSGPLLRVVALLFALLFIYGAPYFPLAYIDVHTQTLTVLGMWSGQGRDVYKVRLPSRRTLRWSDIHLASFSHVQGWNGRGVAQDVPGLVLTLKDSAKSVLILQPFTRYDCRRRLLTCIKLGLPSR